MDRKKLSPKQEEILNCIKESILSRGYPPSVRELCDTVHLKSTSSVHAHLETLEELGYIHRDPTKPRAIEIMDDEFALSRREMTQIPMVGVVTAGEPILARQNITDYFPMPVEMLPNADLFMLKVQGDSMEGAGILSGDQVIIQKQNTARNGEIVCAFIEDSATIKTFYKEDGYIRLQPQNDRYTPIITKKCRILGKVIGLVRLGM